MYRDTTQESPLLVIVIGTRVAALDRRSGARAWEWDSMYRVLSRLAILGNRIIVGGSGGVACLDYATGKLVWEAEAPVPTGETFLIDGDELFVGGAGEVAALSVKDGRVLWHDPFKGWGQLAVALGFPGNVAVVDHS